MSPVIVQTTAPVRDVHADRRPDPVPECSTKKPTTATDPDAEAIMDEFIQKFGSKEEAMEFLARFSSSRGTKEKPTGATTAAPPPPTIPEDSTAQPSISHTGEPQVSIGALAQDQPHVEGGGERADDGGLAEGLERMAVAEQRTEKAAEEENPISERSLEGETLVSGEEVEGETHVSGNGEKGETLVCENPEGETPVVFTEGETPVEFAEGETPVEVVGETPSVLEVGETPGESVGEEVPVNTEEQVPKEGGLTEFVDLVNEPEDDDNPLTRRETRRMARRSLLDEVEDLAQPRRLESPTPGAEVEQEEEAPGSGEELEEAEERRLAAERKRKGKHAATSQPKRSKRIASVEHVEAPLPAPTKVPYAKEPVGPSPDSESEYDEEDEQEEELNYERAEV